MLSHILMTVMCMQLRHVLHMHSLRPAPQCPTFHYYTSVNESSMLGDYDCWKT